MVRLKGEEGGFVPAEDNEEDVNDEDINDDDGCMDDGDDVEHKDEDVSEDVPEREQNGEENHGENSKRSMSRSKSKAMNHWDMAISASLAAFLQVSAVRSGIFCSIPSFRLD